MRVIKPQFTAADITVMLRFSLSCYGLMCLVNADETRRSGGWRPAHSAALFSLTRSMIDCLYNITVLLRFPSKRYAFRESGCKLALEGLSADEKKYRGKRKWNRYLKRQRHALSVGMAADGITLAEVCAAQRWDTLSAYLRVPKGFAQTDHQEFLRNLVYVFWQEYSGMTHAAFQGLMPTAVFYIPDHIAHERRKHFDEVVVERFIATHLARSAAILLCTLSEVQAEFRFFDHARINERLLNVWRALLRVPEVKELYDARYEKLMRQRGII